MQLYIQLACQIQLMWSFINKGIAYFVQRRPSALSSFQWRIDQKEPDKVTDFEDAFEKFAPALLQSFSIKEPAPALNWCDYSFMSEFMYKEGSIPDYLINEFPHLKDAAGFDLQKILRKDIKFIDSKSYSGIQVADLLASGLRKLLRRDFSNNYKAAQLFGKLMVQDTHNNPPIKLTTFGEAEAVDAELSKIVKILMASCRPMIKTGKT